MWLGIGILQDSRYNYLWLSARPTVAAHDRMQWVDVPTLSAESAEEDRDAGTSNLTDEPRGGAKTASCIQLLFLREMTQKEKLKHDASLVVLSVPAIR